MNTFDKYKQKFVSVIDNNELYFYNDVNIESALVVNDDVNDFIPVFTGLYERAAEFSNSPADVSIHAAQYMWQNNSIADRELNFMAFISQLLKIK